VDDCSARLASACSLIVRSEPNNNFAVGPITRILNLYINADMAQTRGVDFEASYRIEPNFFASQEESLSVRALVGYLGENSTTTAAGLTQDLAASQTRPEYSATTSLNYSLGPWGLMLQGTYYDSVMNNITWVEGRDVDDNWIASQTAFNTALSYTGDLSNGSTWRTSFNVTNLFNKDPSIVANANGQSFISGHDTLGRRYQLSLNMSF